MGPDRPETRIQRQNRETILAGALDVFSAEGFRGATLDEISKAAGLSKPNLLYYFPSKEAIHRTLIETVLDDWLAPLQEIDPDGDPVEEILRYVARKLEMSRTMPRESRLFAHEILQGAPHIPDVIAGRLTELVDAAAALLRGWMDAGRLAEQDPHHLIFSIWATTQHYADFEAQVAGLLGGSRDARFDAAGDFLETIFRRALTPG